MRVALSLSQFYRGKADSLQQNLWHPPAHHDKTAMSGAQLFKVQSYSSELMNGPPAGADSWIKKGLEDRDNHRSDQSSLWV
jgi:hypothetical protein